MARRKRSYRKLVEADLETLPLMGLFVVLIPMLLLSAVFLELSVIKMNLPSEAEAAEPAQNDPHLAVLIDHDRFVVEARDRVVAEIMQDEEGARGLLTETLLELAEQYPETESINLISRASTRYEAIIDVMDIAREAGLGQVGLSGAPE